jgi:MtrB/PioB family decaheme-associated outer membrane protein
MSYRRATGLLLAGFVISLAGSGVARAEKEIFGLKTSGDVEVGGRVYSDRPKDDERAKFEEYRDLSESAYLDFLRLRGDSKDDFYTIEIWGKNGGLDDQNFQLRSYGVGSFDFLFEWDQTPHNISRNSQTLTVESPTATFNLPSPRPTPLTVWNSAPKIEEIGFRTDTALLDFAFTPSPDWDIGVDVRRSYKHGDRPLMLPFGTPGSNAVEVPLPVDDTMYEVDASAAFAGDGYQLQFNYLFSLFDNDLDGGFRVDNPLAAVDGPLNAPMTRSTPGTGQGALPPDNYAHTFTLAGGVNLPMRTRLNSSFTYSWRKQTADFLPFTINSMLAIQPSVVAAQAALPNDLDGEVSILRFNLSATSRPMDDMTATVKFRVYDYDDKTDVIPFTLYVEDDLAIQTGSGLPVRARQARRVPYTKWNAGADVRYQLFEPVSVKIGFDWEQWNRNASLTPVTPSSLIESGGDSVLHVPREVDKTNEYTPKVMLDITPLDWLLFRVSYAYSKRDNTNYLQASEEQLALLRKYDMADRKRNRVDVLADLIPMDNLMFTFTFNYTKDDYNESQYGTQDWDNWAAGVDASWKPLDWLRVYVHEEVDNTSRQKFRRSSADPLTLNNPTFDWISEVKDRYDTVRLGLDADLIPEKLKGGVNWNYSIGHTDMNAANPVTPTGTFASSAVAEDFPGVRFSNSMLNVFLRYWISDQFTAKVQWSLETFHESDFRFDGLQPVNPTTSSVVYLGNNILGYNASYFTLSVGYHF